MYDYISGTVAELTPTYVVVDCNGIGYMINISLYSYSAIQTGGKQCKVYIYEAIREDAHLLYGFTSKREREIFELLISVSGVGSGSARMILSSFPPDEICSIIAQGNANMMKSVKGIGAKTAQRIIVDLKDKIKSGSDTLLDIASSSSNAVYEEALAAMVALGFPQALAQKALNKLFKEESGLTVEQAIKKALALCK